MNDYNNHNKVTVLIPCYNEASTIAEIIRHMRDALPDAAIVVFDNNSTDGSGNIAAGLGVEVKNVKLRGKGNVVRRMFADIESDIYLMIDADMTYDPKTAPALVEAISSGNDMSIGVRKGGGFSFKHRLGNRLFNILITQLFNSGMQDVFSGYRAFSRRFVKSFPAHSRGFEIEAELSIFTLEQRIPFVEIDSNYVVRPNGSVSKLRTFRDGFRILSMILLAYVDLKPMKFFLFGSFLCAAISLFLGVPLIEEWSKTGLVPRQPTAILSSAMGILSAILFVAAFVAHGIARSHREIRHLSYLSHPPHVCKNSKV